MRRPMHSMRTRTSYALASDIPGILVIVFCSLALFFDDIFKGLVAYERDTYAFYAPLTIWFARQLQAGTFALWTPLIFGGYPLFADGEIGVFYPINLLLFPIVPPDQILTLLRVLHLIIAGVGMLAFLRTVGIGRLGAVVGGIVFG